MRVFLSMCPVIVILSICSGCNQADIPNELKKLSPVTITVMDGPQALEGVLVTLSSKGAQGAYACNALTDARGVAEIQSTRTPHTVQGVPAGTYAVVLAKTVELPPDLEPQETDQDLPPAVATAKQTKLETFLEKNQPIPKVLTASVSSPIELVVEKSKVSLSVDLAKYRNN